MLANRLAYLPLRGMSEDRIAVLAEEYFDGVLRERVLPQGTDLLRDARRDGHRVVLIGDGLRQVVEPLVAHLRHIDDFICNRLEFRDGTRPESCSNRSSADTTPRRGFAATRRTTTSI